MPTVVKIYEHQCTLDSGIDTKQKKMKFNNLNFSKIKSLLIFYLDQTDLGHLGFTNCCTSN